MKWTHLLLLAALAGCSGEPAGTTTPTDRPDPPPGTRTAGHPARDLWYVTYVMGAKVGYQHSTYVQETRDDRALTRVDSLSHMVMKRGASRVEMDVRFTDWTTDQGTLVEFTSRLSQLGTSIASRGRVVGDKLRIETDTQGKTVTSLIPWPGDCGGFNAVEQSLARKPLEPGEKCVWPTPNSA